MQLLLPFNLRVVSILVSLIDCMLSFILCVFFSSKKMVLVYNHMWWNISSSMVKCRINQCWWTHMSIIYGRPIECNVMYNVVLFRLFMNIVNVLQVLQLQCNCTLFRIWAFIHVLLLCCGLLRTFSTFTYATVQIIKNNYLVTSNGERLMV